MKRPLSHYLRHRTLPRLLLAVGAGLVTLAIAVVYEATVRKSVRPESLLFPAVAASKKPPTRVPKKVDNPLPLPEYHDYTFVVEMRVPKEGMDDGDFRITTETGGTSFTVDDVDYVHLKETRTETIETNVLLLFDQSNSIKGYEDAEKRWVKGTDVKDERVKEGKRFVSNLPAGVRAAVVSFPSRLCPEIFPPEDDGYEPAAEVRQEFTEDRTALRRAIQALADSEKGGTPLKSALKFALGVLRECPAKQSRVLICFSDGEGDFGEGKIDERIVPDEVRADLIREAKKADVKVCFVVMGLRGEAVKTFQEVARETGGVAVAVKEAEQLAEAFHQIATTVINVNKSVYKLTIRAKRESKPFQPGEELKVRVEAEGKSKSFSKRVK